MRIGALVALLCAITGGCFGRRPGEGRPSRGAIEAASYVSFEPPTDGVLAAEGGASPGDERGPGRFASRGEEKSFYAAAGGQRWYYLNLYYWAPTGTSSAKDTDTKDLWIREKVVEEYRGLRHWPDGKSVEAPPPKTTLECWQVGASSRTITIDNHKDFWKASDAWCAGEIHVTMTLQLGRLQVRDGKGAWSKPRAPYVLLRRDYGEDAGLAEGDAKFVPLEEEPVTVWEYSIPWSAYPGKVSRSTWDGMRVPELVLVRRFRAPLAVPAPVTTPDR